MTKKIPEEVLKATIGSRLIPFIGAGYSFFFGYPNWQELLWNLVQRIEIPDIVKDDLNGKDPLQVAEALLIFYKNKHRASVKESTLKPFEVVDNEHLNELSKLIDILIEQRMERDFSDEVLKLVMPDPTKADSIKTEKLRRLSELKFKYIVTTNYDRVLEEIFEDHGFRSLCPGKGDELGWDESGRTIFKIHGDIESPEGTVFTHSQYYNFMSELGYYKSKLYTIFSTNVILMMGYGFNDINVHQVYYQFRKDYRDHSSKPTAYMVLGKYDRVKLGTYYDLHKSFLESSGIHIIDDFEDIPEFVDELVNQTYNFSKNAKIGLTFGVDSKDITDAIRMLVIDEQNPNIDNFSIEDTLEFMLAIKKIFTTPDILAEEFDTILTDGVISQRTGIHLFKFFEDLIEKHTSLKESKGAIDIAEAALMFVNQTSDFSKHPNRVRSMLGLLEKIDGAEINNVYDQHIGKELQKVLRESHTKFGRCWESHRVLNANFRKIPKTFINEYLAYLRGVYKDPENHFNTISDEERDWLSVIQDTYPLLKDKVDGLLKLESDRY